MVFFKALLLGPVKTPSHVHVEYDTGTGVEYGSDAANTALNLVGSFCSYF